MHSIMAQAEQGTPRPVEYCARDSITHNAPVAEPEGPAYYHSSVPTASLLLAEARRAVVVAVALDSCPLPSRYSTEDSKASFLVDT